MPKYIDADALDKKLSDFVRPSNNSDFVKAPLWNDAVAIIESMPAADVAPVRHARWVIYKAPDAYHCGLVKCSFCGEEMIAESDEYNFCPNCGAKMDGRDSK